MTDREGARPRAEERREKTLTERLKSFLHRSNERAKERAIQRRYGSFAATHHHHTSGAWDGDVGTGGYGETSEAGVETAEAAEE